MPRQNKVGRPAGEPTVIIRVPVDKVGIVEKLLGRTGIAGDQVAHVMVRVPQGKVKPIRAAIKKA